MMIHFEKYQGTGNDFIMLDNSEGQFDSIKIEEIQRLCDRRFGIGADGIIWIKQQKNHGFEMRYFNADGSRSFCGNGARCAVKFAHSLHYFDTEVTFLAIDGEHSAYIDKELIHLKMMDVTQIDRDGEAYLIHTGSPHYLKFVSDLTDVDIVNLGKSIRYADNYKSDGINVNALQRTGEGLSILTYERGVEDETLSCGTGATAAALALVYDQNRIGQFRIPVVVKGGELLISGDFNGRIFSNIYLSGPAEKVFDGKISL